jgi:HTH-type transcriptional regulator/antitoxin HigA
MGPPMWKLDTSKRPGEALREALEAKGWTQEELAMIAGRSRGTIAEIISGRTGITPEMAVSLGAAFENEASEWLNLDAKFRLAQVVGDSAEIQKRMSLFTIAPVRDMQKRGWIQETIDVRELEEELKKFFSVSSLDRPPDIPVATRRNTKAQDLTPQQRAWCFRAREMATALVVRRFNLSRLQEASKEIRSLAAYRKEAQYLPQLLADYGIRFVVVEPLPGAKIDGAAFWLDEGSPVIATSVRYDRIDAFWFTAMHEFAHIQNGDAVSVDNQLLVDAPKDRAGRDDAEQRADAEASSSLVPKAELESFIRRIGPLYSKTRIIQFAHRIKIHPGIIVGQLQHYGEISFRTHREMLVRIRDVITAVALTDGWGHSITPSLL